MHKLPWLSIAAVQPIPHPVAYENSHFIVCDSLGQEFGQNLAGQFLLHTDWDSVAGLIRRVQEGFTLASEPWQ